MSIPNGITDHCSEIAESTRQPYRILVADEHPIVREGLAALINRRSDMRVIAEASSGREAVDQFVAQSPDLAILELKFPLMEGIKAVKAICAKVPAARLVVFTTCLGEEDIYRALRAGAFGYVLKDASLPDLIECILAVAQGRRWIPASVAAQLGKRVQDRELTAREKQILYALSTGMSNKQIGSALDISEATVKVHVTHILEKLKVTGRMEAINVALRRGLVHMDQSVPAPNESDFGPSLERLFPRLIEEVP